MNETLLHLTDAELFALREAIDKELEARRDHKIAAERLVLQVVLAEDTKAKALVQERLASVTLPVQRKVIERVLKHLQSKYENTLWSIEALIYKYPPVTGGPFADDEDEEERP